MRENMAGGQGCGSSTPSKRSSLLLMIGSALSNQSGAALATLAFQGIGPIGVVAIRQWVAALTLALMGRPRLWRFTGAQWGIVLGLAAVFAVMNLSLYMAIERIGLGLAVALEFVGPLALALLGSRRLVNLFSAVAATMAVLVLARPTPSTDYLGIGLALLAALCWGSYILLNSEAGVRLPGLEGSAAAALISGMLYLPIGWWALFRYPVAVETFGYALAAGILSSAIPFLADLLALKRISSRSFALFTSVNPVFAGLIGFAFLEQKLDFWAWISITVIVGANITALAASSTRERRNGEKLSS